MDTPAISAAKDDGLSNWRSSIMFEVRMLVTKGIWSRGMATMVPVLVAFGAYMSSALVRTSNGDNSVGASSADRRLVIAQPVRMARVMMRVRARGSGVGIGGGGYLALVGVE
jgi:hypothetical protein